MTKIKSTLFELSKEEKESSISMYGKIVKCLVAPYHRYDTIPLESNNDVYVYPERDLTISERKNLMSIIAKSDKKEIKLVTSDVFIIKDIIKDCIKILKFDGSIISCPVQTFAANEHTILLEVLQNDDDNAQTTIWHNKIYKIMTDLNKKTISKTLYKEYKETIQLIGEDMIRIPLEKMLNKITVI